MCVLHTSPSPHPPHTCVLLYLSLLPPSGATLPAGGSSRHGIQLSPLRGRGGGTDSRQTLATTQPSAKTGTRDSLGGTGGSKKGSKKKLKPRRRKGKRRTRAQRVRDRKAMRQSKALTKALIAASGLGRATPTRARSAGANIGLGGNARSDARMTRTMSGAEVRLVGNEAAARSLLANTTGHAAGLWAHAESRGSTPPRPATTADRPPVSLPDVARYNASRRQ